MTDIKSSTNSQPNKPNSKIADTHSDPKGAGLNVADKEVPPHELSLIERIMNVFKNIANGDLATAFNTDSVNDDGSPKTQSTENQLGNNDSLLGHILDSQILDGHIIPNKRPDAAQQGEKQLTIEDIEKMKAAAAGESGNSGFSDPPFLTAGRSSGVESIPRDLGISSPTSSPQEPLLVPINETPIESGVPITPPIANNDGFGTENVEFTVYERGLLSGSDQDPNNPNPPAQPGSIVSTGNILTNDD